MALFDFLRRSQPAPEQSKSMVGYFNVASGEGRRYKYGDLADEGYLKNAIVYRCVNEVAKGAAAVPYLIKAGGEVIETHPACSLLDRPNPLQSNNEFFNALFGYLLLSGNAYILNIAGAGGAPRELHLMRPDRINIKSGSGAVPLRYEYVVDGRVRSVYEVDQETGASELKQIKLWNPLDDFYGLSPMSAAAVEVDQHNLASKHNISLLNNGARPSGAVIFKPRDEGGFTSTLSDSQRQQLLTDLNNRFSGAHNTGRPMLLEGDFDWREMGLSPKDMDFINLKHMSATDIAMCFGVPSQLVGVPDAQTYANVAEARLALYEETIIPYLRKIESDINEWLMPLFDDRLYFCYDIDRIPALAERRRRTYENITQAVANGIISRNEAREQIGLSPVEGGDELYISANLFPLGSAGGGEAESPVDGLEDYEEDEKAEDVTNFPKAGDNKKISLRNSQFPQFDADFAETMADDDSAIGRKIWSAGGNIRGNGAYRNWVAAREGSETPSILAWIREREAWAARHSVVDGNQFVDGETSPTVSSIAGVVALIKWGVINPKLGESGMKEVVREASAKLSKNANEAA